MLTLILDNGPAHTSRHTRAWRARHPFVRFVFTPKHASWVNPIESVFGILTRQVLRHGWFEDADDMDARVQLWTRLRNTEYHPVRFTWSRRQAA